MPPRSPGRSDLDALEAESLHILREIAATFSRPVLLYSMGKDSNVLLHLARKAFAPARVPLPILHVDTGYKFPSMIEARDSLAAAGDVDVVVFRNEMAIADGASPETLGISSCCRALKTDALLAALRELGCDAAIGGARRDEERSRAKERIYSVRDPQGGWDPRRQRPELWDLYNGTLAEGESIRAFPLSNWTELDIWHYIAREEIAIHPLYFAEPRPMAERGDFLIAEEFARPDESVSMISCRYRTLGCGPCTGAVRSEAATIEAIIEEMTAVKISERSTRVIDHDTDGSMERKKREGYF